MDTAPRSLPPDCGKVNKSGLLKARYCFNRHFREKRDPWSKLENANPPWKVKRWSTNVRASTDLEWNDKDLYTLVVMPGIMMDTELMKHATPLPTTPHSLRYNSLVAMLHRTAIQSLSDLPAATERLKSRAERQFCLHKCPNIPAHVMRFHMWTNIHLRSSGSCYHKDKQ